MAESEATAPAPSYYPTRNLRFVARSIDGRTVRILQQQYHPSVFLEGYTSQWRDVPFVEKEEG